MYFIDTKLVHFAVAALKKMQKPNQTKQNKKQNKIQNGSRRVKWIIRTTDYNYVQKAVNVLLNIHLMIYDV